jgi:hypothetical protein
MDSVGSAGSECERHVDPPIHHDPGSARRIGQLPRPSQPLRALEFAISELHPVDPGKHGGPDRLGERMAAAASIDDQAQDGATQKSAVPSMGLDADA